MAFKKLKDYNEERFGGWFLLRDDGDYADVIFLYQSTDDVLVADTHYIKSSDYSGYVHCCGRGCPACNKNIRVQSKLFIPMFNITDKEVQFWDRSTRFEYQLMKDVFEKYPNPSEIVFRITRHGEAGSMDTRYEISARARNNIYSYEKLLSENSIAFPDSYNSICKEYTTDELYDVLNSGESTSVSYNDMPDYEVKPRESTKVTETPDIPESENLGDIYEEVDF